MTRAWLLSMKPHGDDRVPGALRTGTIMIGWGKADGLKDATLSRTSFRDEVMRAYHADDRDRRSSGRATGQLWRFLRGMSPGDIVLVPDGPRIHVARITGDPTHDSAPVAEHHAHKRPVEWLTGPTGVLSRGDGRARPSGSSRVHGWHVGRSTRVRRGHRGAAAQGPARASARRGLTSRAADGGHIGAHRPSAGRRTSRSAPALGCAVGR